jgi:retinol dehydrogenase-12
VNHLSTALVPLLLLPLMIKTAKTHGTSPCLELVSSEMHYMANITPAIMNAPAMIKKMSSKEHCTSRQVLLSFIIACAEPDLASWPTATRRPNSSTFSLVAA